LDTEFKKYFFIFPRQIKVLSSGLLTKKIWESTLPMSEELMEVNTMPSVSYLESYMKIYNFMRGA
jgi:hypothetical protein